MKVNILTSTAFHVLPLACELQKYGIDVHFYSFLPKSKTKNAGLMRGTYTSLFWLVAPFLLLLKVLPSKRIRISMLINNIIDTWYSRFMRKSDIVIALGSVYLKVLKKAKTDGAITIVEWGSKHSIEQRKCFGISLDKHADVLERELEAFDIADYIAVASQQVAETFVLHGIPLSKLLINPYGVDLSEFPPTLLDIEEQYDLIAVGGWRYEKGSDLLVELCQKYGFSLLHVGGIVNMPFPEIKNMKHVDSVPQSELTNYYRKSKVFVLPSRAEGLSLVQAQAISSGLPVVCSKETGGRDLRELIDDGRWIIEMEELNVDELKKCVEKALLLAETQKGLRNYTDKSKLTWCAYGNRYFRNLMQISYIL